MTITVENLVSREVQYCVSYLVSSLAQGYGNDTAGTPLADMVDQAFELASPIEDWEETQIEAKAKGYLIAPSAEHEGTFEWVLMEGGEETDREGFFPTMQEALEALAGGAGLEPYQREVFEHWIVSDWLADQLAAHGEKVDKDFAGLTVWARTCTGQAISADSVLIAIHAELTSDVAALSTKKEG